MCTLCQTMICKTNFTADVRLDVRPVTRIGLNLKGGGPGLAIWIDVE